MQAALTSVLSRYFSEGWESNNPYSKFGNHVLKHESAKMCPQLVEACKKCSFDADALNFMLPSNFKIHFKMFEVTIEHTSQILQQTSPSEFTLQDGRLYALTQNRPEHLTRANTTIYLYRWDPKVVLEKNLEEWTVGIVDEKSGIHCCFCGLKIQELGLRGISVPSVLFQKPFFGNFNFNFNHKLSLI